MSFEISTSIPMYPFWLTLSVSDDPVKARNKKSFLFGKRIKGTALAIASHGKGSGHFGLFFKKGYIKHGTIAHEVLHITHRMLSSIKHKFKLKDQEPHAYLCEWITNWIYFTLDDKGEKVV